MEKRRNVLFSLVFLMAAGCGDDTLPPSEDAGSEVDAHVDPLADGGTDGGLDAHVEPEEDAGSDAGTPACEAHAVACQEASFADLNLLETAAAAGLVTEEGTTDGEFLTYVDATGAPSTGTAPTTAYVYARFTETGLEQLTIDDDDALASTDWDIALRRYIIRINSGVSGPSCVRGARLPPMGDGTAPTFDDVTEVPDGLELYEETYFTESAGECTFVSDGSGLPGAPDSVLASYWSYAGCLAMTDNVFVLALRDGRHVKLTVVSYYTPDVQTSCDESGSISSPSGAANFRIRWAFLD